MNKHSLRQYCGTAKSARSVAWARIGKRLSQLCRSCSVSPAGWVAAQDVGGKAPLGEEVLEPDAAEPDRDAAEPDMVERGWLEGDTATGDWGGLRTKLAEQGITFEGGLVADFLALARAAAPVAAGTGTTPAIPISAQLSTLRPWLTSPGFPSTSRAAGHSAKTWDARPAAYSRRLRPSPGGRCVSPGCICSRICWTTDSA